MTIKINLLHELFSKRELAEIMGTTRQNLEQKTHLRKMCDVTAASKAVEAKYKNIQTTVREIRKGAKRSLEDDSS